MPIVTDKATGRQSYVSAHEYFSDIGPEFFFRGNDAEYLRRVAIARRRILSAISTTRVPLAGRGTNHEFRVDVTKGSRVTLLVDYIDAKDGRQARRLVDQKKERKRQRPETPRGESPQTRPHPRRRRSPQDVKRRRSALFGGKDIPQDYAKEHNLHQTDIDLLVEIMRWRLMEDAVWAMYACHELMFVGDTWYVPVSVMDEYKRRGRSKDDIKNDFRPFHGRPNRDRYRDRSPIAA